MGVLRIGGGGVSGLAKDDDLLPCSFCGNPAGASRWPNERDAGYHWMIGCIGPDCLVSMGGYDTRMDAVAAWNARAGWLPIATAPKDGTNVWLASASSMCVAFWSESEMDRTPHAELWVDFFAAMHGAPMRMAPQFTPTYWRPLPNLPRAQE